MPRLYLALQEERDHERVKCQRFDECQSENHRQLDPVRGIGVAADTFHRRRRHPALTESRAESADSDRQTRRKRDVGSRRRVDDGCHLSGRCEPERAENRDYRSSKENNSAHFLLLSSRLYRSPSSLLTLAPKTRPL